MDLRPDMAPALRGSSKLVVGVPKLLPSAAHDSERWQECTARVRYSPAVDTSQFALPIVSDTPGGVH